jgi:hypothetical protein
VINCLFVLDLSLNVTNPVLVDSNWPKSSSTNPVFFGTADQIAEKKLHSAKIMPMSVGATVLVNHFLFVA